MPEGMVPELLIVGALLLVVAGLAVSTRRKRRTPTAPAERPTEPARPAIEAPARASVEAPAPEIEAPAPTTVRPPLRDRLAKSRRFLASRLAEAFGGGADEDTWDDLEAALIQADVGVDLASQLVSDLRDDARGRSLTEPAEISSLLGERLVALFDHTQERGLAFAAQPPSVWMVVGVNGTGKTTTIGKLAADLNRTGRSVALAAADTFRAAADEQLGVWADRSGATVVKHQPGADPGAVAYDAWRHARARGADVLIVDTAGRLHTKTPLMDELGKIRRVIEKEGKVDEVLLVIDATAGQNGLVQAREFAQAAGVTGVVLTKLDGTAKGGIALAIERQLEIPIKLIGVGESIEDLEPFDPKTFVDALIE